MSINPLKHIEVNFIPLAMFLAVALIYGVVLLASPQLLYQAIRVWGTFFIFFLPFVIAIIGLLGIFEAFVSTEIVSKHLGDKKKVHGYLFALAFGTIVSASQYAIFPTIKLLKRKGARTAILATFMVAWSGISLPLIPLEAEIFGPKFVAIRLAIIAIGAIIFGLVTGMLKLHIEP